MTNPELTLGITDRQIKAMLKQTHALEYQNDAIALTSVRHAISMRLVEIRVLLQDGHLNNLGGRHDLRVRPIRD